MKIEILLISLLLAQNVIADPKPGKPVTCDKSQTDCSKCPVMYQFNWIYDQTTQKCHIEDCNASTIINFSDQYCLSCQSDYSNTYFNGSACVKSSDSCFSRSLPWTDSDCQACKQGKYAIFNGQVCSQYQCNQKTWTDQDCQKCNPSYVASPDQTKCVNTNGVSCTQIKQGQIISDQFCQACYQQNYYADVNLEKCVQSSDTCGLYQNPNGNQYYINKYNNSYQRKTPYTDDDCKICNSQYALPDQSGCFSCKLVEQYSLYSDQLCQKCFGTSYFAIIDGSSCVQSSDTCGKNYPYYGTKNYYRTLSWTDNDCVLCKQGQYAYQHQNGCFTCPSSNSTSVIIQFNDEICQKCFGKQYFAALDGYSCVQSSDSCNRGPLKRFKPWTDNDCQLCKAGQYASFQQNQCFTCQSSNLTYNQQQNYNDEICQKCYGQGYFATIDGQNCVQSQFTCGKNSPRFTDWTDSDCQLCKAGQYAYKHQSGCFFCTQYSQNDEVCQKCVGQEYFAANDGQCVQSQDTCGNNFQNQRLTPWTDKDCQLCKNGQYAYAKQYGCFNCQPYNIYNKLFNGFNDEICIKCFGQGHFAAFDKQSCVQSSDSCEAVMPNLGSISYQNVRLSPWSDQDCQLCKAGQLALPDKLGCYSCPSSYQGQYLNDLICQLCFGSGYYATLNGSQCVQSSDTCGRNLFQGNQNQFPSIPNRQSPWTDQDCQLCQVGQYATLDKTSCFTCNYQTSTSVYPVYPKQYQLSDYICQICVGQGYFLSATGICVHSSDTCGVYLTANNVDIKNVNFNFQKQKFIYPLAQRNTAWTDQDCFLCQTGYYANYDKSFCSPIQCNNQKNWTDSLCQQCGISYSKNNSTLVISYYASIDKTQCVQTHQSCSNSTNVDDLFCQTCYKNPKMFASLDGQECLQLQDSCDSKIRKALWTDSDCQKCKKGKYATFDKKSCAKTANCSSQKSPFSDDFCQQCSEGEQYASKDGLHCLSINHSCTYTGSWSEKDCLQCFNNKKHVNIEGTACVQSQDSCVNRNSAWTNQDCKLCYPQKNIQTNLFGTECIDIDCKKTSGWTDYDCYKCDPLKPFASSNQNSCSQQK
ncbi:cell surface immobilization antigen (macronuclear) [Tetrahymena thermophila SB210]|uniref:Cell surface immobilization antigen n=1 Tax=Tetrahymena thermophila (strain SB210) TaxID=312017 RepID=Q22KC3_TETTS|nr:cell surface immobilization antigen [Tetrahymena thermophila SB210]EAR85876.1 cell surface immobilization antigen [Tetrahymena thermophila SB210]|eukprot:XP_001033539.1 cell surface immobilization antigen [Tetrahymena thermophila SB210]